MEYYISMRVDGEDGILTASQIKVEDHEIWCLVKYSEGDVEWVKVELENIFDTETAAYDSIVY